MTACRHQTGFVPVSAEHYPLLRTWLSRPHIREWWGDPETELGFIRDMVEGRDTTRPFLILERAVPVGYIQYWFVGHHQNEEWIKDNPWLAALARDAVGVDLSIGDQERLSRGLGSAALRTFVEMLRAKGHRTIIVDPDPNNARAVRAYETAGFRPISKEIGASDNVLIMQHQENMEAAS
jgi:RimJ/RimL family protein N-acetyltransferase